MIRLQLNNEWLDTYADETVELSWTGFRFQKELRSGFTNDMNIPKTERNIRLLGAVGLLDSQTQMFGTKTVRCIMQVGLSTTDMMIQVAGITSNEIKICLYEDTFPETFKGKTLNEYFVDNSSSIYPWKNSSVSYYPNAFMHYSYGMPYNSEQAQYHPVKSLRSLLSSTASFGNYTMPMPPSNWMLMATKKTVCPYNRVQVIEFNNTEMDGSNFMLHGGQHITNDLTMSSTKEITFNRNHIHCNIKAWVVWRRANNVYSNKTMYFDVNGQHYWHIPLQSGSTDTNCEVLTLGPPNQTVDFSEGDKISFSFPDVNKMKYVSVIVRIEYTSGGWYNYITSDDFGTELEYVGRDPSLRVEGTIDTFLPMDGYNHAVHHKDGTLTQFSTENLSFAYFGYYCNLPEIKICDLWHSLQWLMNGKLSFDHQRLITLESANAEAEITGTITETRPKTDKLGQKNYIKFKGETVNPLFTVPNEWLSLEYTIHESIFVNTYTQDFNRSRLAQYSNPEYNEDYLYYTCDFNEIEGAVLMESDSSNVLHPLSLFTFGFEELNQSVETTIETYTPFIRNKDIVWIDGRRYLVISGKTSLDTNKSELVCLLFPKRKTTLRSQRIQINSI